MEALRRELAEKAQLTREQANDLQENARMHREMHENEEARAHETLAAQAERWKTHCDQLTQQRDAGMAEYAERVSEMERDMDELSAKYIEVSEKLEQWDLWWQEASTNAREAETIDTHPEGLTTIAEEERRPQPTTPICTVSAYYSARVFASASSAKVRSQKFPEKGQ